MTAVVVGSNGNRHEVPLHSSGDWHYTCDDLVKYWKNGQLVDYTVEAVTIDGYTSEVKSLGIDILPTAKAGGFLHQPPLHSNRGCCVLHDVRQALLPVCPTVRYVLV